MTHHHNQTKPHVHKDPSGVWTVFADADAPLAMRFGAQLMAERLNRIEDARKQRHVSRT